MAPHVTIIGGGMIGLCAAYYLAEAAGGNGETITVVENTPELLMGPSGAANGVINPNPSDEPICQLHHDLLNDLKDKYDGFKEWCHRPARTVRIVPREEGDESPSQMPSWLPNHDKYKAVVVFDNLSHMFPRLFCEFIVKRCAAMNVTILTNTEVTKVDAGPSGSITAVHVQSREAASASRTIPCEKLLISAGAWTSQVINTLFPSNRLDLQLLPGLPSIHWLNVRDPRWTPDQEGEMATQSLLEESLGFPLNLLNYSNGVLYVGIRPKTGPKIGDHGYMSKPEKSLPRDSASAELQRDVLNTLRVMTAKALELSSVEELEVLREGRAFYPTLTCDRPISAEVPLDVLGHDKNTGGAGNQGSGVFISTGHENGCSWAVGNGKVLSEMMLGETLSCDMNKFGIPDSYIR